MKGSYILVLQLEQPRMGLQIGHLGSFDFASGYYLYVGSAFGPGGLKARLAHHIRRHKLHPHWHIDYLRAEARLREAWAVSGLPRMECFWCQALRASTGVSTPVPRFGSADTKCYAHLFYLPRYPHPSLLTGVILGAVDPDSSPELRIEIYNYDD